MTTPKRTRKTRRQREMDSAARASGKVEEARRETHKTVYEQRRQTQSEALQQRSALQERRAQLQARNHLITSRPSKGPQPLNSPPVSFAGGITRSIFMAIVLVVMYALVTHSQSSSGAISNIGGIFGKFTSTQPLFVNKVASGS